MLYPIQQFEGYMIDKAGNVYTNYRTDSPRKLKSSHPRYKQVVLYKNGKRHNKLVHSLMLEVFVSSRPEGHYALHNNGDTFDNRLENLRWGTPQDNMNDKIKHGNSLKGCSNGMAKLNDLQVKVIRHAYSFGSTQGQLSKIFNVCQTTISKIILNKRYQN